MAFQQSDADALAAHLKAIVEVELFTIPLYLTAANSTLTSLAYNDPAYGLQKLATSVAVQEMYHLQQACNLANAFNVTPEIPRLSIPAGQKVLVPHLDPDNQLFYAELGNLPHAINEMVIVETPDDSGEPVTISPNVQYRSISDLYTATLQLLSDYVATYGGLPAALDPHFYPGNKQVAYGAFPGRFNFNKIMVRTDVINTVNAITDQGEGNTVKEPPAPFLRSSGDDGKVLPQYQGNQSDRFYEQDMWSHYYRFQQIVTGLETVLPSKFYAANGSVSPDLPSWAPPASVVQDAINTIWSFILDTMQAGFATGDLPANNTAEPKLPGFNSAMVSFKYTLPMLWQYGICPSFIYRAGVTAQDVQNAMDSVDPWCLFHWDATTSDFRLAHPDQLNSCQGLNDCSGRGWGTLSTQPGDGACATADTHTCVGSNSCTHQGACGYFATGADGQTLLPPSEQWVPNFNTGAGTGGCQTPISTLQVFSNYPDDQFPAGWESLKDLRNTAVWDRARSLLAQKLAVDPSKLPTPVSKQVGDVNYDGLTRRTNTTASSTKS